jgi:HAD superfamily hydrolase (TIGR01548 family)
MTVTTPLEKNGILVGACEVERPGRALLRIDMNEGVLSNEEARELLAPLRLVGPEALMRYPDDSGLVARYAAWLDRDPTSVLATAGADDAIDRIMRCVMCPTTGTSRGDRVVITRPTFGVLGERALRVGARLDEVPWGWGSFPVNRFVEVARGAACAFIVSPNNPTGLSITPEALRELRERLPGTLLVVDAAYEEFSRAPLTATALSLPDTLVLRTLSKAWALAGLRVGFVLGPPEEIASLRAIAPPFPIARSSLLIAERAIATQEEAMRQRVERVRGARQRLARRLAALATASNSTEESGACEAGDGCPARPCVAPAVTSSDANFVLLRHRDASALADRLRSLDVCVRRWPVQVGSIDEAEETSLAGAIRITVTGERTQDDRALAALEAAMRPAALLLDMDGVLVDVSGSYREAIRLTAASYGVTIGAEEIAEAKRRGNANNDWVLTRRLLAARGVTVPIEEIIERFDGFYRGGEAEGSARGLQSKERTLVDKRLLASVAALMPIGIVTGRPLRDAQAWLDRERLAATISVLVTMEDAPPKPAPEPVELALARLGASSAWFVGDTVDDIRAARRCSLPVVPIGVCAPAEDGPRTVEALRLAGASVVAGSVNEVLIASLRTRRGEAPQRDSAEEGATCQ